MINRVIWIVLDSVGVGELPDAKKYDDIGANTLCHILEATGTRLHNLESLGLGYIDGINCVNKPVEVIGNFGKCNELSVGKDTTVGHWEMAGVHSPKPLPTYPNGFPEEIMKEFVRLTGHNYLTNAPYSGTEVLKDFGEHHLKTGDLIVYTSADSVFQIAAHEEIIPLDELYRYCEIARGLLIGEHGVARVIARPFIGIAGAFKRTSNRHDYSLSPPGVTILNQVEKAKMDVVAIGKIEDIFNGQGITRAVHTESNMDGVDLTIASIKEKSKGLIFTNLVEFDSNYGHRNDVTGYAKALLDFDQRLPEIMNAMMESDVLIINADHGCDPTTKGSDHTREYIPLIIYGKSLKKGVQLGIRNTFSDIGQTIADMLKVEKINEGTSFKSELIK